MGSIFKSLAIFNKSARGSILKICNWYASLTMLVSLNSKTLGHNNTQRELCNESDEALDSEQTKTMS